MTKTLEKIKSVDYGRGNGSMMISLMLCVLAFTMLLVIIEFGGVYHTAAVAQTRADAIADSAASYALSQWDKNFNEADAQFMAASMQAFNNNETVKQTSSDVKLFGAFRQTDKIEVTTKAHAGFYFIKPAGGDGAYTVARVSAVETAEHTGGGEVVFVP
jgi:Flp pilus assembly protein TadG